MEQEFIVIVEQIVAALKAAGYDPYMQLYGYATTGDLSYITRSGNARSLVSKLDRTQLEHYVCTHLADNSAH